MPLRAAQTSLQPQPRLKSRPQAINEPQLNLELGSRLTSEPSKTPTQSLASTPDLLQF